MAGEVDAFILLILACIFPPAAAGFVAGCGTDLCLNILLTILGYFPGCIHAFWLILRRAEANERYGYKNWTYNGMGEYVPGHAGPPSAQPPAPYGQAQAPQAPPPPPPPPPGQYPAPPPSQAPVDQKPGYVYVPPPAPQAQTTYSGYQTADQRGGYVPPPAPAVQKDSGYQAPPQQAPTDQKQADSTTQSAAPSSGT